MSTDPILNELEMFITGDNSDPNVEPEVPVIDHPIATIPVLEDSGEQLMHDEDGEYVELPSESELPYTYKPLVHIDLNKHLESFQETPPEPQVSDTPPPSNADAPAGLMVDQDFFGPENVAPEVPEGWVIVPGGMQPVVQEIVLTQPEPQEELPVYDVAYIWDSGHPKMKTAEVLENGTVVFYLPEGTEVEGTVYNKIHENITSGKTVFPASQCLKVKVHPDQQRACKFLSPSLVQAQEGAEVAEGYDFERPFSHSSCRQPHIVKESAHVAPECSFTSNGQLLTMCPFYEPEPITVERAVTSPVTKRTLKLLRTRRNFGMVEYSITLEEEGVEDPTILGGLTMSVNHTKQDVDAYWAEVMESHADVLIDAEDVAYKFQPEPKPKESYLSHVIAE